MARKKLDTYENQAGLSLLLAVVSAVAAVGLALAVFTAYNAEFGVMYVASSLRYYAILLCMGGAMFAGGIALLIGFNSAGRKTNRRSQLSWLAFFISAGSLTVAASSFIFFWLLRFPIAA